MLEKNTLNMRRFSMNKREDNKVLKNNIND